MSFKCLKCGHIFEDGEEKTYTENYGEPGGKPYLQWFGCCPLCGGDFEEMAKCKVCGEDFSKDELSYYGVCECCKEDVKSKYKYRPDLCYKICDSEKTFLQINKFLAEMFTQEEIEQVLFKELVCSSYSPVNCESFINADDDWFVEKVVKGVGK
jgi:hypothetical protein